MLRRRAMMQAASGGGGGDSYVTDGLLLRLDGEQNTRAGHNPSATVWEDLSGNAQDYNLPANKYTINSNNIAITGGLVSATSFPIGSFAWAELVGTHTGSTSSWQAVIPFKTGTKFVSIGNNVMCFYNQGSSKGLSLANYRGQVTSFSFKAAFNGQQKGLYVNGEEITSFTTGGDYWNTDCPKNLFCYKSATSYPAPFTVYSLRIYNRVLTDAEREQNYRVDQSRFGLP